MGNKITKMPEKGGSNDKLFIMANNNTFIPI